MNNGLDAPSPIIKGPLRCHSETALNVAVSVNVPLIKQRPPLPKPEDRSTVKSPTLGQLSESRAPAASGSDSASHAINPKQINNDNIYFIYAR